MRGEGGELGPLELTDPDTILVKSGSVNSLFGIVKDLPQVLLYRLVYLFGHSLADGYLIDHSEIKFDLEECVVTVTLPDNAVFLFASIWPSFCERNVVCPY